MAKSLRSKVKRSYRSKKRDDSIYAATEAARLSRLNAKLRDTIEKDTDGDVELQDEAGWCFFAALGLLDPSDLSPESLSAGPALLECVQDGVDDLPFADFLAQTVAH